MNNTLTRKAALLVSNGDAFCFSIKTLPLPRPGPSQILVRLSATGICGTDLALASGEAGAHCDILGHEGVGYVSELGTGVDIDVKIGDRVGVAWVRDICGTCTYCLTPDGETRCLQQYNSGRKWEGTFAEYVLIPARYVIRIPEELSLRDEVIAPILCGGVTAYKALKVSNVAPGKWIAVLGAAGGVGALAIQYARAMGYRVLAVDISSEKANFCRELGAEAYLDVAHTDDFPERVSEVTSGQDASCVLVIAGSSKAYELGLKILAPFGVLTCVGIPPANQLATFHPLLFIDKGIRIIGSAVGTRKDILEALSFVERGLVTPSITLTSLERLTEITQFSGAVNGKYVMKF